MGGGVDRALGLASIGVGFLATVVVAVAVSADYWLYTDEPIDTKLPPTAGDDGDEQAATPGDGDQDAGVEDAAEQSSIVMMVATHSGLWRFCIDAKVDFTDEDYEELMAEPRRCDFISYFGQDYDRLDTGATTSSILRDIRKATPVITLSLVLMLAAQIVNVVGHLRKDYRTIVGAVLSIVSALGMALGHIFYISAVNDEVTQWKRPDNATDEQFFSYQYGWAFYAAGSSFIFLMAAAVGNITVYVRRYYVRHDVRRILTVVPGLEAKMASAGSDQPDDQPETLVGVEVEDRASRPTAGTSNAIF